MHFLKDQDIQRIVDIGAGYGRVGLVMSSLFPRSRFIGLEILEQRKNEGNRIYEELGLINCEILQKNVLVDDYQLPDAQVYFIYDFSEVEDLNIIMRQLSERKKTESFFLITRGDRIDSLLANKYKNFWSSNGHVQCGALKIYSSTNNLKAINQRSRNGKGKS